jgi:3-oxoadipate enol-lactonase
MSMRTGPDRFIECDGVRLRWRLEGSGPAIALLHGWALDLQYWDPAIELLAPHFTVLRFDRRGFGLSGGMPDNQRNAADLHALLDMAGIQRVVLLGMSQGARLAIQYALLHPARARALVLDGAPSTESTEPELPMAEYRALLQAQGEAALRQRILQHPLMRLQVRHPATEQLLAGILGHYRGLDLLQPAARRKAIDPATIQVPALIINGQFDSPARRDVGQRLQQAMPAAQRVELPDAGHLALLDNPHTYTQAVIDFYRRLP